MSGAKGPEVQDRVVMELSRDYFESDGDVTSYDTLTRVAEKAGLDRGEVEGGWRAGTEARRSTPRCRGLVRGTSPGFRASSSRISTRSTAPRTSRTSLRCSSSSRKLELERLELLATYCFATYIVLGLRPRPLEVSQQFYSESDRRLMFLREMSITRSSQNNTYPGR